MPVVSYKKWQCYTLFYREFLFVLSFTRFLFVFSWVKVIMSTTIGFFLQWETACFLTKTPFPLFQSRSECKSPFFSVHQKYCWRKMQLHLKQFLQAWFVVYIALKWRDALCLKGVASVTFKFWENTISVSEKIICYLFYYVHVDALQIRTLEY